MTRQLLTVPFVILTLAALTAGPAPAAGEGVSPGGAVVPGTTSTWREPIMGQAASGLFLALWIEGENYQTAPVGLEQNVGLKPPASGGKVLYGENMAKEGNVVTYEFALPADVKDARIIFRYARGDRKVASVELALSGPGGEVKKGIGFDETKGWGMLAKEYKLLPVELGDLKKGKHALKLTSLAQGSDVSIDGFFVAAKDFKVTAEELNHCCRIRIVSEGYVGLARPANAVRQDVEPGLRVAVRSFSRKTEHELAWVLTKAARAAKGEETILRTSDEEPTLQPKGFPDLEDGAFKIAVSCKDPPCRIEEELFLCGKLLSVLPDRLKAVKGFTADMADVKNKDNPSFSRALADLQHIVQYLEDKGKQFGGNAAADESASKRRLAALEGVQAPDALIGDMRRAADQAEKMIVNLKAGKDAYDGMVGDVRRAYRSAANNSLIPYRVFVPDAYAKADKVRFIYMLHGGGGDENSFPDMDGGKILEVLNRRGYLAVCPRWNSRDLLQLLQLTLKEYPKIDPDRVYCTGLSMGGFGTYTLATEHPEFFAAVCCVSGTGDPARAEKLKNVPLQIFQGAQDPVVAPAGAQKVAARMKELGYVVDFRLFPKYGHDYHADEYLNLSLDFFGKYARNR